MSLEDLPSADPDRASRSARWRRRRRLVVLGLPWLILLGVGGPMLWRQLDNAFEESTRRNQDDALQNASELVVRTIDGLFHDINFVVDLSSKLHHGNVAPDSAAATLIMSFARSASTCDQVRWIDANGMERLRIERAGQQLAFVPAAQLQDKRSRPYFRDTIGLPAGGVYFSRLDLNVEHGQLEKPYKPTLRVASPLVENKQPRGIIVLNFLATPLLDQLSALGQAHDLKVYVANADSYWLRGPRAEDDWAWQLGMPYRTLGRAEPGLWRAIQASASGHYRSHRGDWAFRTISIDSASMPNSAGHAITSDLKLILLVQVDPALVAQRELRWKLPLGVAMTLALIFAAWFGAQLIRSVLAEDRRTQELQDANLALMQANNNLRSVQNDLQRAERLSSLGLMVAGVAHELNTPLGSAALSISTIRQALDTLKKRLQAGLKKSDLDAYIERSEDGINAVGDSLRRASGLVQRFKQVAIDRTTMDRRRFELADVILDSHPRLRRWDPQSHISLKLDIASGIVLDSYPGPLEQVISNLLENALSHAFADRERGLITITASADSANSIRIRFADDGVGVDPDVLSKIFDPFFTTRRHAGGTGLGLHISHQIVTEVLGGTIQAKNNTPAGTGISFTIRIPLVAPHQENAAPREGD